MTFLKFLFGKGLLSKEVAIKPGTIYLDTDSSELYYDDPSSTTIRSKIIDTGTLLFEAGDAVSFPSEGAEDGALSSSSTSAKLGTAVLGSMILGT